MLRRRDKTQQKKNRFFQAKRFCITLASGNVHMKKEIQLSLLMTIAAAALFALVLGDLVFALLLDR